MPTIRRHGLRPLTHAVLAALCFALPACIQDVIVPPPDDNPPDVDGGVLPPPIPPSQPPENQESVYYDPLTFAEDIQVQLDVANCSASACHDSTGQIGNFALIPAPEFGSVEMWSNLLFVTSRVNLAVAPFVAESSPFYQWATDGHAGPTIPDPQALRDWLEDARARYSRMQSRFDADVFERQVQVSFDEAGCAAAGCHAPESGLPFPLFPRPAPGSVELAANLQTVISLIELDAPSPYMTVVFERTVDRHGGAELSELGYTLLLDWIQAAMDTVIE